MRQEENRFETIHQQHVGKLNAEGTQIIRDRETGVCYMYHYNGATGGLTALLNADGTPFTIPVDQHL